MSFFHALRPVIAFLLGIGGFVGLIGTSNIDAFFARFGKVTEWASAHFNTQNSLFVALIFVGTVSYVQFRKNRDTPLTILSTVVQVEVDDSDDNTVTVTRWQIIRPRHPKVSAIYTTLRPSHGGEIAKENVNGSLENDPSNLKNGLEMLGSPRSGWQCMHVIEPALPFPWYTYFVPDALITPWTWEKFKTLRRCAVRRKIRTVYMDPERSESDEQYFELTADRYLQKNLTITLVLPSRYKDEEEVRKNDCVVSRVIARAGVEEIPITFKKNDGQRIVGTVHIDKLKDSKFGIYWKISEN